MEQTEGAMTQGNVATEPAPATGMAGSPPPAADPFALDEASLASLSPEQRASLDPILDGWKKRASEEINNRERTVSEKYRPYEEKATAFDNLAKYQPFVQWWQAQQQTAQSTASPQQANAIGQTKPADIATNEEWQNAIYALSQGDSSKLSDLQARMMAAWATPFVQKTTENLQTLNTKLELKELFEEHPDAKELDQIGLNDKKEGTSILEFCLEWAENNRKPLEDGYRMARRWADSMKVGAQQQAMGMVNGKKSDVTAGPSTSSASRTIVEVDNADDLIKRSLEAQLSGQKDTQFQIRRK